MEKSAAYILSAYSFISTSTLQNILSTGYKLDEGNPIPSFDEKLLINLCADAQKQFSKEKNILEINGDLIIVGDIHGSFHDLLRILKFVENNKTKVLFLGDYVDRGEFSLECITLLFALKVLHPTTYFLIRGNHEFDSLCSIYGFKSEITFFKKSQSLIIPQNSNSPDQSKKYKECYIQNTTYCYKYTENLYSAFLKVFSYLPIAAIVNRTTFCIHGGLSPKLNHVDEIETLIQRPINNFETNELLLDLVWSDPSCGLKCLYDENPRGCGHLFNCDSVLNFLRNNSFVKMVRGHQCVANGSSVHFGEKCITIFSASSYDKLMNNSSAILQLFEKDDTFKIVTFPPLKRLQKCEAFYYKVQPLNLNEKAQSCFTLFHPTLRTSGSLRIFTSHHNSQSIESMITKKAVKNKTSLLSKSKFITNRRKLQLNCLQTFNEENEEDE